MKKQIISYFFIVSLVVTAGCSKNFLDINTNPNSATNTTPELVLPNALKVTAGYELVGYTWLCGWMDYWAPSGSYATSATDVASYNQTNDTYSGSWGYYYHNLEDYDYVEKQSAAQKKPFYEAAAKIMKTFVFQRLVDQYGNIPYTQALQGTSAIQPKYDSAQSVYVAITNQLDTAITLLQTPNASGAASSDILFGGSASQWIAFANSLRLRILIRQTQISGSDSYIKAEIAKMTANEGGFLTTDAGVNPGYFASSGKQSPTYGYFRTVNNLPTSGGQADYWIANQYSLNFLTNHNDPRLSRIYAPVTGSSYIGNVLGSTANLPSNATSSFGRGILQSQSQPAIIFTAAESYFLQAEANLRGYFGAPTVDTADFKKGVQASFTYLGAGDATAYVNQPGDKQVNLNACTTMAERLACIIRQKWVAMNSITPFEAWSDYRRLGLPSDLLLSVSSYRLVPNIPIRTLYPTSEYSTNGVNVAAQGTIDPHTSKIFWMQ